MSETETQVENILTQLTELIPEIEDQLEQLKIMIVENSDDEEVIEQARDDAFALVAADPELDTHPDLAAAVRARVDAEQAAYLERG